MGTLTFIDGCFLLSRARIGHFISELLSRWGLRIVFFFSVMHYSVLSKPIYSVTTMCLLRQTGCGTTDKGRKGNFASVWNAVSIWRLCAGFQGGEKRTNKTKLAASESLRTPCVRGSDWQQEPSQVG